MVETLLSHLYDYAEVYTVLLMWLAAPLGVLASGILLRRQIKEQAKTEEPALGDGTHGSA